MDVLNKRPPAIGWRFATVALFVVSFAGLAFGDRVTLTDGRNFPAIWIESFQMTPDNGGVFQARMLQQDNTWTASHPVPANLVGAIEFRGPGDLGAAPTGRTATLITSENKQFENVTVESLTVEGGKYIFHVRQAGVAAGGASFPVAMEWLSQATFSGQGQAAASPSANGGATPFSGATPASTTAETSATPIPPVDSSTMPVADTGAAPETGGAAPQSDGATGSSSAGGAGPAKDLTGPFSLPSGFGTHRSSGVQFAIGNGLWYLGLIVAIIMWFWMWILMFQTGILWGLSQFLPCVSLVFFIIWLIQNWSEAKMPFLIYLGGAVVAGIGGALMG